MKIAYICTLVPWLQCTGGTIRTFHAIRALSCRHQIELFVTTPLLPETPDLELAPTHVFGYPSALQKLYQVMRHPLLPSIAKYASPELIDTLCSRLSEFDCVVVDHLANSYVFPFYQQVPTVYIAHNVESLLLQMRADHSRQLLSRATFNFLSRHLLAFEKSFIASCNLAAFASELDHSILGDAARNGIVFENGVDTFEKKFISDLPVEPRLLFVGSLNYFPNIQALDLLFTDLLPRVRRAVPGAHLDVVGFSSLQSLPVIPRDLSDCVTIHTNATDVAPYYRAARGVVVPLLSGSGSRLKVLEAMAFGRPVISTTKGIEGLNIREDEHCLLGDSNEALCDQIIRVLLDDKLANEVRNRARQQVECNYDWRIVSKPLVGAMEGLLA